jgi:hypothetical protein
MKRGAPSVWNGNFSNPRWEDIVPGRACCFSVGIRRSMIEPPGRVRCGLPSDWAISIRSREEGTWDSSHPRRESCSLSSVLRWRSSSRSEIRALLNSGLAGTSKKLSSLNLSISAGNDLNWRLHPTVTKWSPKTGQGLLTSLEI